MDITDPYEPRGLWEFSDQQMGYSYGKPLITQTRAGSGCGAPWVVVLGSGLNNSKGERHGKDGDGRARLYFRQIDPATAVSDSDWRPQFQTWGSEAGSVTWPAGLGMVSAYQPAKKDPVSEDVYGGDQRGNLWRFSLNSNDLSQWQNAQVLASLRDVANQRQAVTSRPSYLKVAGKEGLQRWVMVGTGRLTQLVDAVSPVSNSFYAVKDDATLTNIGRRQLTSVANSKNAYAIAAAGWRHDMERGWHFITDSADYSGRRTDAKGVRSLVVYSALRFNLAQQDNCGAPTVVTRTFFRDVNTGALLYSAEHDGFPGSPQLYSDADGRPAIGVQYGNNLKLVTLESLGIKDIEEE